MHITFLSSNVPLTKAYARTPTGLDVEPYPMVRNFTSALEEVNSPREFAEQIYLHAQAGDCLLKGLVKQPLLDQSRANSTDATTPTEYLVLDLDFNQGFATIHDFLAAIGVSETSFLFQHSASAGIKYDPHIRGHVFLMLDQPIPPQRIKQWLIHLNLTHPVLREQITLSANGMTLKFPLDITTCQNDKLIYIAPPVFFDAETRTVIDDPVDRFLFSPQTHDTWTFPDLDLHPERQRQDQDTLIAELRERIGLRKLKPKTKMIAGEEVLINPDRATVTGTKSARGFTYVNLNGGDSWGYFYPDGKPDVLYNFKGEPPVLLRALDPEFVAAQRPAQDLEQHHFVLRDSKTDTYYTCALETPDPHSKLEINPVSSKEKLIDFSRSNNLNPDAPIPVWTVVFDPHNFDRIHPDRGWVNLYEPPALAQRPRTHPEPNAQIPPTIHRIIFNIVNEDQECFEAFINWLAVAYQTRDKIGVAWLFQGIQGTGKGILFERIITPLFGPKYCLNINASLHGDKFNGFRATALMIMLDEIKISENNDRATAALNRMKGMITETTTTLRAMRRELCQVRCYDNFIMSSNQINPVPVEESDRRINIAPRGEKRLEITNDEVLALADDLPEFAQYLHHYPADLKKAQTILDTEQRRFTVTQSANSIESVFRALRHGDLEFFAAELKLPQDAETASPAYQEFARIVRDMIKHSQTTPHLDYKITRDDLHRLVAYLRGQGTSPGAFTKMLQHHGIRVKPINFPQGTARGVSMFLRPLEPAYPDSPTGHENAVRTANNVVRLNQKVQGA